MGPISMQTNSMTTLDTQMCSDDKDHETSFLMTKSEIKVGLHILDEILDTIPPMTNPSKCRFEEVDEELETDAMQK